MPNSFSYWEKKHFFNYDILIAGSGIVGLNAALRLKEQRPYLTIAILEASFLPSGASTKNAGFACFGSISELISQEQSCGTDGLHALIEKRWKGLQKLRNNLGDAAIDLQMNGGYEVFKDDEHELAQTCVDKIEHFNTLIADIVKEKQAFRACRDKIGEFGLSGITDMIVNITEAQIDTGSMMRALLTKALEKGITIYNSTRIENFSEEGNGISITTNNGLFKCRKLVLCTNAFIKELLPELNVVPGRGQVVVTSPIKDLKISGTYHYQQGYYYFRNIDGRVLLGGGRNLDFDAEQTSSFGSTPLVQDALENMLREMILPGENFTIDYSWSGIMAFGDQLAPIIKEVRPGVFCAVRCNGMGVAIGSQTGEDVADLVLARI